MPDLPTGTVTFLFTDIEGSTKLWEQAPDAMRAALVRHDACITAGVEQHGGVVIKDRGEGDSFFAVFAHAADAVAAACAIQQSFLTESWNTPTPLRVRIALHTGEADLRDGGYYGAAVNRCARLRNIAHGGQTLLSQTTYDLVRDALPKGANLRDMGLHRLQDLQRPEQVFQLLHPDLPADFPPLKSLDALPNNLPQQLTSFIGRESEMAEVKRLLAGTRLLTLTGAGGCGKTRLALQVAADVLGEYRDGVWLVELASLSDPSLVTQTVASALGVREQSGRPLIQILVDYLKPKNLLLLLDNCEHLLSACAQLSDSLLRACPNLRILASSREGLGIVGEQTHRVPSLSLPDPHSASCQLALLTQYEAVRLFVDRAALSQSIFTLTDQNAPAVAQICWQLDGIPLAIELAAARMRVLSAEQIVERLDDRFRLLTGGSRTALPRQQTLRALIDWSYELLSEAERMLFQRSSVFAGGFDLEAAEAVCAGAGTAGADLRVCPIEEHGVLDLLTCLVDKSLVVAEEQGRTVRYRMLKTMRQYSRDRLLESGEAAYMRARHRDYFLTLAERAEIELRGPQQLTWLERLEAEHDNLRAAMEWSAESGEVEAGLRLGGALWRFWWMQGYLTEGREQLTRLLSLAEGSARTAARAKALCAAGALAWWQGDIAKACMLLEESAAIYRELGEKPGLALSLKFLGESAHSQGDHAKARSVSEESVAIWRKVKDQ